MDPTGILMDPNTGQEKDPGLVNLVFINIR